MKEEQKDIEEKLHWFRDFVSLSGDDSESAKEYMDSLSKDIFSANVYVFTPLGKVVDLPTGATALDFAYKIHTKVGDSAVGAVVNGIGGSLNTVLKTGDVCEIRTSKNAPGPNESWLEIAKTASAQSHIKKALQKKDADIMRDEKIRRGKEGCAESFKAQGFEEDDMMKYLNQQKVLDEYKAPTLDDLFILIAGKNPTPGQVIAFLNIRKKPSLISKVEHHDSDADNKSPVYVKNAGTVAVSLAHCCTPIPGDGIVGYITRGKGITVHRSNCPNIASEHKRLIDVYWKSNLGISTYPVDIEIYANDRVNLIAEILSVFSSKNITVSDLKAHLITETMNDIVTLTLFVSDAKTLNDVFALMLGVKGIYSVARVIH